MGSASTGPAGEGGGAMVCVGINVDEAETAQTAAASQADDAAKIAGACMAQSISVSERERDF